MIFENLKPRLDEAIEKAKEAGEYAVNIIYNEIGYPSALNETFEYLFSQSVPFETIYGEHRFVILIKNKK